MPAKIISAEPYEMKFDPKTTALLIIDMQRDFVEPGGCGESLGQAGLAMIKPQGGIFGWVSNSTSALTALAN